MNTNDNNDETYAVSVGVKIVISIGLLIVILLGFNQCNLEKKPDDLKVAIKSTTSGHTAPLTVTRSDLKLSGGSVILPMNSENKLSELDESNTRLKDFEQIYYSMAEVTGVKTNDSVLRQFYKSISTQLPTDKNSEEFLSANKVAVTKLASEFCSILVETSALRVMIWPNFNFSLSPLQAFTPANKQMLIKQAITRFWPPTDQETIFKSNKELGKLIDEALKGENLKTAATTKKTVKSICTAILSNTSITLR